MTIRRIYNKYGAAIFSIFMRDAGDHEKSFRTPHSNFFVFYFNIGRGDIILCLGAISRGEGVDDTLNPIYRHKTILFSI